MVRKGIVGSPHSGHHSVMTRFLRKLALTVSVLASALGVLAPTPAVALSPLPYPSTLGRPYLSGSPTGSGIVSMVNSSGQKIGEFELYVNYWHGSAYSIEAMICVRDTLGNGRGVIARLLMKYGSDSSIEVGKFKGGSNGRICSDTLYKDSPSPVWAIDVDHGEDWAGTPYRYTGHYSRFASLSGSGPYWPYFP